LMWVVRPARAPALRLFGLSFAIGTMAGAALTLPPDRWLIPACDALSLTYVAAAAGTGIVFVALSLVRPASLWVRLGLGLGAGVALLLALALAFPACLAGPYATL